MKRTRIPKIINTSFNISQFDNFNRNVIYPYVVEPFTPNINEIKPTIEIIEINSDESEKQYSQNSTSYWPSVKSEDENEVKGQTNGKRNITYEQNYTNDKENHSEDDLNETFNSHCGGDYDKDNTYYNRVDRLNNNITFDTSSDDQYDDIKIIYFNDTIANDNPWDFNSYVVTDHDEDIKKIIYSLKDMKNSGESEYEVSNVSFNDSTSCSTDDEIIKNKSIFPTPIFNWIPKLKLLSSSLPTVKEITEPYRHSSSDITDEGITHKYVKKSANSWFDENTNGDQSHKRSEILTKLSTLSQREKRRNKVANILNKQTETEEQDFVCCKPECNSGCRPNNVADKPNITINKEDAVNENVNVFDAPKQLYFNLAEPQIKCNSLPTARTNKISEPIEELGESSFDNNPKEVIVYDYDLDTVENSDKQSIPYEEGNSNGTFVSKCLDVSQNVPEHNSIPYLQLSSDTNFDEEKSCFRRFFKFILCCK